ncbi:hypothetical protein NPIL_86601 [Nephila pilipes]|uniref:Uncharacterized protein n=1 Tax=Nephila pilipes TaxID=299642 RepID=A0A8X6Q061_NEPPI|nr:hypothetical protein NPIL_86601 [Nephila pilipes]
MLFKKCPVHMLQLVCSTPVELPLTRAFVVLSCGGNGVLLSKDSYYLEPQEEINSKLELKLGVSKRSPNFVFKSQFIGVVRRIG